MLPSSVHLTLSVLVASIGLGCDGPQLERLTPSPGAEQVDPHTSIEARFLFPPPAARLVLAHPWGTPVPGESTILDVGRWITFVPADALRPHQEYVAQLTWDGAEAPTIWTFEVGGARSEPRTRATGDRAGQDAETARLLGCRPVAQCFNHSPPSEFSGP